MASLRFVTVLLTSLFLITPLWAQDLAIEVEAEATVEADAQTEPDADADTDAETRAEADADAGAGAGASASADVTFDMSEPDGDEGPLPEGFPNYPIRAMGWLDPGSMPLRILTAVPHKDIDRDASPLVRLGRVMFRYPGLLGGYAARAGLSCDACHPSGRSERAFLLPPLSPRRGTVDVTNALFGERGENDIADPLPIPDLRHAEAPFGDHVILKDFLRHTIVTKFDGVVPDETVLDALQAYLEAIRTPPKGPPEFLTRRQEKESRATTAIRRALDDAAMTLDVLGDTVQAQRPDLGLLVADAYRAELGRIAERLHAQDPARANLTFMGRQAEQVPLALMGDNASAANSMLAGLKRDLATIRPSLIARADLTFYDLVYLEALLAGDLDPKPECEVPEEVSEEGAAPADAEPSEERDCIPPEEPEEEGANTPLRETAG